MEENNELVENNEVLLNSDLEEANIDENYDDSSDYVKAKTFPINEEWPEEIKKQVEQLNQMSAMINSEPDIDDEEEETAESEDLTDESEDEDEYEDEDEDEENTEPSISTEETETFTDIF